jgi:hypothetical protein
VLPFGEWHARHDRGRRDHFGREPYPSGAKGPRAGAKRAPPAGTFARAGQWLGLIETNEYGRRRAGGVAPGAHLAFANEKARGHLGGAGSAIPSDDGIMPVICPTSQIFRKMRWMEFGKPQPHPANRPHAETKARCPGPALSIDTENNFATHPDC